MKGIISRAAAVVCLAGGLGGFTGCQCYRDYVDPCSWERYASVARNSTLEIFGNQVGNGHVLNQTVWNYHFETGSDKLAPIGLEHLGYLSRVRPQADPKLFLQTAHDIVYDPAAPEKYERARAELDAKRQVAIQRFLATETSGRPIPFTVTVLDAPVPGLAAPPVALTVQKHYAASQGVLSGGGGGGAVSTGGGGGGSR